MQIMRVYYRHQCGNYFHELKILTGAAWATTFVAATNNIFTPRDLIVSVAGVDSAREI